MATTTPPPAETGGQRITLLHVITDLDVGGAELSLARLLTHMDRRRFHHHVVSLLRPGPVADTLVQAGIDVTSLNLPSGRISLSGFRRFRRMIRDLAPALVNSWLYHADLLSTAALLPASRIPLVWNLRASHMDMRRYSWVSRATRQACAWLSARPDLIVANSVAGRDYHQELGYRARAWQIIFNGIDTDRFSPDPHARQAVREELGIPAGARIVGLVARFDVMKGHAVFMDAVRRIAAAIPDAHFLMAGQGVDTTAPFFADWLAANASIASRVHPIGRRSDTARLMASLDVYCSPSLGEGFPNAPAEAMACGVPTVASDAGDSRQIVGDTGIVVPIGDAAALADGCIALLRESPEAWRRRSGEARRRIVERFGLARAVSEYEDMIETVLARRES